MRLLQPTRLHPSASLPLRTMASVSAGAGRPGRARTGRTRRTGRPSSYFRQRRGDCQQTAFIETLRSHQGKTMRCAKRQGRQRHRAHPERAPGDPGRARGRVCGAHGAAGGTRAVQYSAPPDLAEEYRNRVDEFGGSARQSGHTLQDSGEYPRSNRGDHADSERAGHARRPAVGELARVLQFCAGGAHGRERPGLVWTKRAQTAWGVDMGTPPPGAGGGAAGVGGSQPMLVAGAGFEPATFRL